MRGALARNDLAAADAWLNEARTIGFSGDDLKTAEGELAAAREQAAQRSPVVGANSLQRIEYVAPKFPAATRNRGMSGWVELEFTVLRRRLHRRHRRDQFEPAQDFRRRRRARR